MSAKDCLKYKESLDPDDLASFEKSFDDLVKSKVPVDEAYTQAAEIVMDGVLGERNKLAAEVRAKDGSMEDLTIENLLNPQSYGPSEDTPVEAEAPITRMTIEELDAIADSAGKIGIVNTPVSEIEKNESEYLDELEAQIKRDGITRPINVAIDKDGKPTNIWDGMHRLAVMHRLGIKDAPVRFTSEDQAEIEALAEDEYLAKGLTPDEALDAAIGATREDIETIGEKYVYHATFTKNVKKIKKKGITPMTGASNWVASGDPDNRYNQDGGVFAFGNPEAALRWAWKMNFTFDDKDISIIKAKDTGDWSADPAPIGSLDKSFKKMGAIKAADIVGSIPLSEFSTAPKLGLGMEEYQERAGKMLEDLGEPSTSRKPLKSEINEPLTDLSMDKKSRLKRAREMGFDTDTVYYHGTNAVDFEAFDPDKGLGGGPIGIWLDTSAENYDMFMSMESFGEVPQKYSGGRVIPVYIKKLPSDKVLKITLDGADEIEIVSLINTIKNLEPTVERIRTSEKELTEWWQANLAELRTTDDRVEYDAFIRENEHLLADERKLLRATQDELTTAQGRLVEAKKKDPWQVLFNKIRGELGIKEGEYFEPEKAIAWRKNSPYERIELTGTFADTKNPRTWVIVRDPSSIRSIHAVFDPAATESADILKSEINRPLGPTARRTFLKRVLGLAVAGGVVRLGMGPTDNTTLGRAKVLSDEVVSQMVPPSAEKLLREDGSLPEVMRILATEGPKELRPLAARLAILIPPGKIKIVVDDKPNPGEHGSLMPGKNGAVMTLYTGGRATGLDVGTVLHEALHAAVAARYYKLGVAAASNNYKKLGMSKPKADAAIQQFRRVWSEFNRAVDLSEIKNTSIAAAYSSPDEFFTRALTDPVTQKFMAEREYKGRTLLDRFIEWVKVHLLGYEKTGEIPSWLDAALLAANDVLDASLNDDPDFSFASEVIKFGERLDPLSSTIDEKPALMRKRENPPNSITDRENKTRLPKPADVDSIGRHFDKLHKQRYRRKGSFTNKSDLARAKRGMTDEINYQLEQAVTGKGWYDEDVHEAMALSDQFVKGLLNDPTKRQLMTIVSGILSNGNKASMNWAYAIDVMRGLDETKKMPTKSRVGETFGRRGTNIAKHLTGLGKVIEDIGIGPTVEFFMGVHTGREIRAFKKKYWPTDYVSGRFQLESEYFGARLFGPKIGSFAMALNGVHGDDVVMDIWATRTMNRHMGRMTDENGTIIDAPRENERAAFSQIVSEIASELNLEIRDAQAILWYFEQQLFTGLGSRTRAESFSDGARTYIANNEGVQPDQESGAEVRETASKEVDPGASLRAKQNEGASRTQIEKWLKAPLKRISQRIKIDIVSTVSELPGDFPEGTQGAFIDGKIYLVSENIPDATEALTVLVHEVVGHLGLEGSLGKKKFDELLGDVMNLRIESMLNPGAHPAIEMVLEGLQKTYVDEDGKYNLNPREEAREILAHIAHGKPRLGQLREIYNKLVNWMRQAMFRMGFGDPDIGRIEELLTRAVDYIGVDTAVANKAKLVVAGIGNDGELYIGEQGDLHFNIVDRYGDRVESFAELGYADEEGNFLTREEALEHSRGLAGFMRSEEDEELDGLDALELKSTGYVSTVKPALMRRPPEDEEQTEHEKELFRKLGLDGKETESLWQMLSNLRMKDLKQSFNVARGRAYEGLFDGLIEGLRLEEEAEVGMGKDITYTAKTGKDKGKQVETKDYEGSFYIAARLATGISDMMTHLLHYGSLQWAGGVVEGVEGTRGLLELFNDLGVENLNKWLVWMGANRAREIKAKDAAWNAQHPGSTPRSRENNLNDDEIAAGLAINIGNEKLFTRIKNEYADMNIMQLNLAEEAGLIDPEKRAEWESQWYVPFYRQSDDDIQGPHTSRGLSHQSAGIRRLTGSDVPTGDLLQNILQNWIKLTDASVKNHALRLMTDNFSDEGRAEDKKLGYISDETAKWTQAFVPKSAIAKFIEKDRDAAILWADRLGMEETATTLEIINELNKLDKKGFEKLWSVTAPTDPDVIRVQRGGKNKYYRVHVPGLLRAIGHMSEKGNQSRAMKAGRWFKQLLTLTVTASPDFMLRNFIRDAVHSWAINPDGMRLGVDSLKGLKDAAEEGLIHRAMMAAGASFQGGYIHGTDPEATNEILRRELKKAGLTKKAISAHMSSIVADPRKLQSILSKYWQHYRAGGDKIENASRVAVAEAGRAAGKPTAQWLFESKDLMDYSRRGNYALLVAFTDLIPFLNARLQGADKLRRAAMQNPKTVASKIMMMIGFTTALLLMNDDDDRYQELEDWDKDAYWHFWVYGEHVRLPKPFEIGIIGATIPERMIRGWITKSQPSDKLKWSILHNMLETMNVNPIPQIALPVFEVVANRSFYFDRPIESLSDQRVIPSERYNSYTSQTAMELGDTRLAAWLSVSPKQLQHLWNGYTGTLGAYGLKVADFITRGVLDYPGIAQLQPEELPVVRTVFQGDKKKGTQWQIDFYDRMKEVEQIYGTFRKYATEDDPVKAKSWLTENKTKLAYRNVLKAGQMMFSKWRWKRKRILANRDLTASEKYTQSQEIQAKINALAKKIESQTRAAFTE